MMSLSILCRVLLTNVLLLGFGQSAVFAGKPNVIVILADDLGRGDYSAFGTKDIRTPHIDSLYSQGMALNHFRANSSVCSPTRAALLTGCYPDRVGVPGVIREEEPSNSWGYLSQRAVLLPQVLRGSGYHSAIVGKWHLGIGSPNTPNERGFDFFHGFLGDMMDDYWTHLRHGQNFMRRNAQEIHPEGHATDVFTDWACEYLAERAAAETPFFLYLAYNAPHDPVQPKPEWLQKVKDREPGISEKRAKLVALIEHLDEGIGRVLGTLDRLKLAENTLVFFTSDNGGVLANGANNGPWRSDKGHMYEGGICVPGVARWVGHIPAGSRSDSEILSMDLFPTICEAAGSELPKGLDGRSFLSMMVGSSLEEEVVREQYFVRREGGFGYGGKTIEALKRGDWKVLQDSPFGPLELFNLRSDPQESAELSKKEPKVFREMIEALRRRIQIAGAVPWQKPLE